MNYDEMSIEDLRAECEQRDLSPAGIKPVLVRKLEKADAEALADIGEQPIEVVVAPERPAVVPALGDDMKQTFTLNEVQAMVGKAVAEATKKLITPNAQETQKLLAAHTGYTKRETQDVFEHLKTKYGHLMSIRYDEHQEIFQFEGGLQGRVTTTAKQNPKSIVKVAEQYLNIANSARLQETNPMTAMGKFGG